MVPFDLPVPFAVVLALQVAGGSALGLLAGLGPVGASGGLVLALALPFGPFLTHPEPPVLRVLLAMAGLLCLLRWVDFVRGASTMPAARRVWFTLSAFDIRKTAPAAPALDGGLVLRFLANGVVAAIAAVALQQLGRPPLEGRAAATLALRWLAGMAFTYSTVDGIVAAIRASHHAVGVRTPLIQRDPILSRSLQEFWGDRWNRPVHEWLMRHCFAPLARRRLPVLGVCAAFAASAAIHVWLAFVAVGALPALAMGAFFFAQGALLLVERRLWVVRWRPLAARAWTLGCFAVTMPLFVEPMLLLWGF